MNTLFLRYAHYTQPRSHRLMEMVGDVFDACAIPAQWTSIHCYECPERDERLNLLYWRRFWSAWKAWEKHPAEWLLIADGDCLPMETNALTRIEAFLAECGEARIFSRAPMQINWIRDSQSYPPISYDFGKNLLPSPMICIPQAPHSFLSFGLLAIHCSLVAPILRSVINHLVSSAVVYDEHTFCQIAPAGWEPAYFPPDLVKGWNVETEEDPPAAALVHPVGSICHPNYVSYVTNLWIDRS